MPYELYMKFQWGSKPYPDTSMVKITKSKLVGIHHEQIQSQMQKKSVPLAQCLSIMKILSIFDLKLRLTKFVQSSMFQKFYKDLKS